MWNVLIFDFNFSAKFVGKYKGNSHPWPPYRVPPLVTSRYKDQQEDGYKDPRVVLQCRSFHAMIFILLYKSLNERSVSEHVMALGVFLLELALSYNSAPQATGAVSYSTDYQNGGIIFFILLEIQNTFIQYEGKGERVYFNKGASIYYVIPLRDRS